MSGSASGDIKKDFLKELRGYIPALRDKTRCLEDHGPDQANKHFVEFHRLVHTIKGASSLVKLDELSQVASEFESVIEEIINNQLSLSPEVLKTISSTIDYFDAYCAADSDKEPSLQNLRAAVLGSLLDIRKLATSGDGEDLLSQLLRAASQEESDDTAFEDGETAFNRIAPIHGDGTSCEQAMEGKGIESDNKESLQQELLADFYAEAEDHFQDLGKALGELEDRIDVPAKLTPEDKELLRLIRRSVHTIKGAAAVIKLQTVAGWGHEVEDVLDWLYEDAAVIAPNQIKVIADAADMLERFVTAPQDVRTRQLEQLRTELKRIIGSHVTSHDIMDGRAESEPAHIPGAQATDGIPEAADDPQSVETGTAATNANEIKPLADIDPARTLRVDLFKVESVVNLAAESSVALSAFDQDMENLEHMIAEIDRARQQLNRTARDLELGYEVKAIEQLSPNRPMLETSGAATNQAVTAFDDFDVLELDRYSELNLIIRTLSETAVDVSTISRQLSDIHGGFEAYVNRLRVILSELNQKTMRLRMAPMSSIINRMRRTVRETALQLDKSVRLSIHGQHIELDKMVWERLADPLMHLLRNAVDHGIEPSDVRTAAGKPEKGTIRLTAAYQGNQVAIRISDDGAGFDFQAIRDKFTASHPELDADRMSEEDLTDLAFQSGFSTCSTISEVSGRGVGLDVVRENIRGLKGSVCIEKTAKGSGTTFCIQLPITLAAVQALLFDINGRRYATALHDIKQVLRVNPDCIEGQDEKAIHIDGCRMPFYQLSDVLGHGGPNAPPDDKQPWTLVLIVGLGAWQGAVAIDRMHGQREVVIKNLGTHLRQVKGVTGATTMGDGRVVPILNLEELLKDRVDSEERPTPIAPMKLEKILEIMVVDDSVTIRNVVSRLMEQQGWKVVTAKDGMDAIECLYTRRPDLIVLDIEMPRMNGYEFLSAIRSQDAYKTLPVVMHTSRASKKHREKAAALGVNDFVTKPYDEKEFVALVKRLSCQN